MEELTNNAIVNIKTGDIISYLTNKEIKSLDNVRTSASIINDNNKRKSEKLFHMFVDEVLGRFYHNYYENTLCEKYLFRYVYLCSFMNYKNYIEYGNAKGVKKLVNKKQCQEILKLKDQQFYDTINYFIKNKMIIIKDNGYVKINEKFCNRGKMKNKNGVITRMFDNIIREIYENSTTREHERLGLLLKLLPYVHYKNNVVCHNPNEEDVRLLKPMKQKEILEILHVDRKPINSLLSLTIMNGKESVFIKVSNAGLKNVFVLSPRFTYKGNKIEDIEDVLSLFKMGMK
ncbi:hypothetical protein ACSXE0_15885 (plasmid) [Clostridium perfringens]